MSSDRIKQLFMILAAALVLWGLASVLRRGDDDIAGDFTFPDVGAVVIDTVLIQSPEDTILLGRPAGATEWQVNRHPADRKAIDDLFHALTDTAMIVELVASSPASHARMAVDSVQGKLVKLIAGPRTVSEFYVGKRGPAFGSVYVRRVGEDDVFLLRGRFASVAGKNLEGWRDKNIVRINPDSIGGVTVTRGRKHYTLARRDSTWFLNGRVPADSAAVRRMLERYRKLDASGFPTEAQLDSVDFKKPDLTIDILGLDGDTLAGLVFDSTQSVYWARRKGGGEVYRLYSWAIRQMAPADSTLRAK